MLKPLGMALLAALPLVIGSGCAATRQNADTSIQWQGPVTRLTPGNRGENRVWVDFNDISGGTTDLRPEIEQAIKAKGYLIASSFDESDFVMWTTLRFFDEVNENNNSIRNAALTGAVAGGAVGAVAGYNSKTSHGTQMGNTVAAGVGGALVGGAIGAGVGWMTSESEFSMILDVQLARKVVGGVDTTVSNNAGSTTSELSSGTNSHHAGTTAHAANASTTNQQNQNVTMKKLHLEAENRLVASTKGRRLPREEATASIISKLQNVLPQLLPRAPGAQ